MIFFSEVPPTSWVPPGTILYSKMNRRPWGDNSKNRLYRRGTAYVNLRYCIRPSPATSGLNSIYE